MSKLAQTTAYEYAPPKPAGRSQNRRNLQARKCVDVGD